VWRENLNAIVVALIEDVLIHLRIDFADFRNFKGGSSWLVTVLLNCAIAFCSGNGRHKTQILPLMRQSSKPYSFNQGISNSNFVKRERSKICIKSKIKAFFAEENQSKLSKLTKCK